MKIEDCDNCHTEGNILDMWKMQEPVEEGQRTSYLFCCMACLFEYWELKNRGKGDEKT